MDVGILRRMRKKERPTLQKAGLSTKRVVGGRTSLPPETDMEGCQSAMVRLWAGCYMINGRRRDALNHGQKRLRDRHRRASHFAIDEQHQPAGFAINLYENRLVAKRHAGRRIGIQFPP